jgi:hypothetical protein
MAALTRVLEPVPATAAFWRQAGYPAMLLGGSAAVLPAYGALLGLLQLPHAEAPGLLVVLTAAALSSIVGFAFSAICGAFLFNMIEDPVRVVQVMVTCSIAIQAVTVWTLRRDIAWGRLPCFLLGGFVGLPIGLGLLTHLDRAVYMRTIGGLLLAYGLWMLLRPGLAKPQAESLAGDTVIGMLGGVTGGLAGFPGALVTMWCARLGWDKRRQRGLYQPFILVMQVVTLLALQLVAAEGGAGLDPAILSYVPAALLGTLCGLAVFRRLSDLQFAACVNLLLIASGLGMLL